jgi:predicted secreted protein
VTAVTLRPGASHTVELAGRGSAGYAWEFVVEGGDDVVAVAALEGSVPTGATAPSSYSRSARYELRALQPGRARVRFRLRRAWEAEPLAGADVTVEVEVRA